jgi:hypothetical protein
MPFGHFGRFWLCLDDFGFFEAISCCFGPLWFISVLLNSFGSCQTVWMILDLLDRFWLFLSPRVILGHFGLFKDYFAPYETISGHLRLFRSHSKPFWIFYRHSGQFGYFRIISRLWLTILDLFWPLCTILDYLMSFWAILGHFRPCLATLNCFGAFQIILSHFKPFEIILEPVLPILSHYRPSWSISDHS